MPGDVLCRCCVRLGRIVAGEGPPGLLVLMRACYALDPGMRPTFAEIAATLKELGSDPSGQPVTTAAPEASETSGRRASTATFCPQCGTENVTHGNFCAGCGALL